MHGGANPAAKVRLAQKAFVSSSFILREAPPPKPRRDPIDNRKWLHVAGHDTACRDNRPITDRDAL